MLATVLIFEKDVLTREMLAYALDTTKYISVPVGSIKTAYSILDGAVVSAVIVGLKVTDPESVHLVMDVKAYQPKSKIIVVSDSDLPESLNSLVDAFVKIPFNIQQINSAIEQILVPAAF